MKFFYFLFSIAIAITTTQAVVITHTIEGKETIPMLAKKYRTTKAIIEQMNNLQPNKYVKRGTVLNIALNTAPIKKEKRVIRNIATITKISTKELHSLDEIRKKHQLNKKTYVSKNKPKAAKRIVRQSVAKKAHTLKSVKKKKKLLATLKNRKKSFTPKKALPKRVTVNDIRFKSSRSITSDNNKDVNKIINLAKQKLGRRYVWGAVGNKGTFDCSGFTSYVYKKMGIHIPRTSRNQAKYGKYVSRNNLKKGDLIFFDTSKRRKGYVNHVGIYLGNGKFIHASSAQKKVVVSPLSKFYARRYVGARRPS